MYLLVNCKSDEMYVWLEELKCGSGGAAKRNFLLIPKWVNRNNESYLWIWNVTYITLIFTNDTNARKHTKTALPNQFNITQVGIDITVLSLPTCVYGITNIVTTFFLHSLLSVTAGRRFIGTPNKILCLQISLHFFRDLLWTQKVTTIYVA